MDVPQAQLSNLRSDLKYIQELGQLLVWKEVPKWGSAANYTRGFGLFVPDGVDMSRDEVSKNAVSGVNNESTGWVASWAFNNAENKHGKDAELFILTKIEEKEGRRLQHSGTLYMVQDNGPCRSCKSIIARIWRDYYRDMRVVIWYQKEAHRGFDNMLYGYDTAVEYHGGYLHILPPKSAHE